METQRVEVAFYVEVHDPDGLTAFAETLESGPEEFDGEVSSALMMAVMRVINKDGFQKQLDTVPGMLVVGNHVSYRASLAWPDSEGSASDQ